MNTAVLDREHAIVTVRYVNDAKGNAVSGSIKDDNGDYYGVHKSALAQFRGQEGRSFEFDFTTNGSFRNVDVKTIQMVGPQRVTAPPRAQAQHAQQDVKRSEPVGNGGGNGGYYRPTSPKDARRMFLCSQLNALIAARSILLTPEGIADAIRMLMEAYDATIGQEDAAG